MTNTKALDEAVKRVIRPSNLQAAMEGFWRFGLGKPSAVVEAFAPGIIYMTKAKQKLESKGCERRGPEIEITDEALQRATAELMRHLPPEARIVLPPEEVMERCIEALLGNRLRWRPDRQI